MTYAASIEELVVSHVSIAHHEALDDVRLAAIRQFTAARYTHYSRGDSSLSAAGRQIASRPAEFRRLLRCMPLLERLELLDNTEDAPAVHSISIKAGSASSLWLRKDLRLTRRIENKSARNPSAHYQLNHRRPCARQSPSRRLPICCFRSRWPTRSSPTILLLRLANPAPHRSLTPWILAVPLAAEEPLLEVHLYSSAPLRSLTLVNMADSRTSEVAERLQASLDQAQAGGYSLGMALRVIDREPWVGERKDSVEAA